MSTLLTKRKRPATRSSTTQYCGCTSQQRIPNRSTVLRRPEKESVTEDRRRSSSSSSRNSTDDALVEFLSQLDSCRRRRRYRSRRYECIYAAANVLLIHVLRSISVAPFVYAFTRTTYMSGRRAYPSSGPLVPTHSRSTAYDGKFPSASGPLLDQLSSTTANSTAVESETAFSAAHSTNTDALPIDPLDINIVLLDNYDSYTYNLYQYLASMCINPPVVVANDAYSSWDELKEAIGLDPIDAIVISPGPGTPNNGNDVGLCREAVDRSPTLPILGVCLGHQLLGLHYGADVGLAPGGPVHGLLSPVSFTSVQDDPEKGLEGFNLFEGIEQGFDVVRYHSLTVDFPNDANDSLDIEPIAWCDAIPPSLARKSVGSGGGAASASIDSKVCMALRHKIYPHYGVQFHPESVGTGKAGYHLLQNFCKYVAEKKEKNGEMYEHMPSQLCTQKKNHINESTTATAIEGKGSSEGEKVVSKHTVHIHKLSPEISMENPLPEMVFESVYASSETSFWLDSSTGSLSYNGGKPDPLTDSTCPIHSNSRFSIMGDGNGPLSKRLEYYGDNHPLENRGLRIYTSRPGGNSYEVESITDDDIITHLRKSLGDRGICTSTRMVEFDSDGDDHGYTFSDAKEFSSVDTMTHADVGVPSLPFEYRGGYVGYLGYEVRHDTRRFMCEQEVCKSNAAGMSGASHPTTSQEKIPTAAFLFADRSLVYDHFTSDWYLVGVSSNDMNAASSGGVVSTIEWMKQMMSKLQSVRGTMSPEKTIDGHKSAQSEVSFKLDKSKSQYEADIRRCHDEIRNGESYELCLTNQLRSTVTTGSETEPFGLYKLLRQANPSPFAAFLNFGGPPPMVTQPSSCNQPASVPVPGSVSICCSSPERFLSVTKLNSASSISDGADDGITTGWEFPPPPPPLRGIDDGSRRYGVESKPIKGTTARATIPNRGITPEVQAEDAKAAEELRVDVKNRAENLMIVDLLRNDLSRVCEVGSVHVPRLMNVESFSTVHQLVSTIRGVVNSNEATAVDVIAACFPGGSMTGAPKLRSVDILDEMEKGVSRGPYSGCLGYISLNGCMDMNIIIRTAVVTPADANGDDKDNNNERNDGQKDPTSWNVSIGCGGAITALSESEDEYDEMLLKARAVKEAVELWVNGSNY